MLIKLNSGIYNFDNLAKADYEPANPDAADSDIELHLTWQNGAATILYGDEADVIWRLLCEPTMTMDITPALSAA